MSLSYFCALQTLYTKHWNIWLCSDYLFFFCSHCQLIYGFTLLMPLDTILKFVDELIFGVVDYSWCALCSCCSWMNRSFLLWHNSLTSCSWLLPSLRNIDCFLVFFIGSIATDVCFHSYIYEEGSWFPFLSIFEYFLK